MSKRVLPSLLSKIKHKMPKINFYIFFITAAFPIILGAIYYNPKVLGRAWLQTAGLTEENVKGVNMVKTLLLSYLFGLFLSYIIFLFAVHQSSIYQLFLGEEDLMKTGSEMNNFVMSFMDQYGDRHRTFGHGVIHGIELCVLTGFPLIGISALHEGRSMKYVWIHLIFWIICGALIGGVICQFV